MFFYLSKFAWFIAAPGNLFVVMLVIGTLLLWTRWRKYGRAVLFFVAAFAIAVSVFPIGQKMFSVMEDRFSKPSTPIGKIDGIIVLGGVMSVGLTKSRDEPALGTATERVFAFSTLADTYPDARLIFTGGSGDPFNPELSEAHLIRPLLANLGMNLDRITFETKSRNTVENAQLTFKLVNPKANENWILLTSAFHMPRAVGCFRKAGWRNIIPYPVDYSTLASNEMPTLGFQFTQGLAHLNAAVHEGLGLIAYYLTGKTDEIFPAPDGGR